MGTKTHGHSRSHTYITWCNMKARCLNPDRRDYKNYGGRGIKVCDRWMTFENFLADMGEKPKGLTLERINVDGDYDPNNCQWATYKEQANNWRKSIRAEYEGKSFTAKQLSEMLGVGYERIVWAIKKYGSGWLDYINKPNVGEQPISVITGRRGVSLHKASGRYSARVWTGSGYKSLGYFATVEEAAKAVESFKSEISRGME